MKQLKIVKNAYSVLVVCLIVLGIVLMLWPKTVLGAICKILGILLVVYGLIKVACYFTDDMYQLAFQFDLGLGIVSMIGGLVMLFRTEPVLEIVSICIGIFILVDAALKIQTSIDAKRFGIEKWWIILSIALLVAIVGILLITTPFKAASAMVRGIGIVLCLDGILNLLVVQNTVRMIRRNK